MSLWMHSVYSSIIYCPLTFPGLGKVMLLVLDPLQNFCSAGYCGLAINVTFEGLLGGAEGE